MLAYLFPQDSVTVKPIVVAIDGSAEALRAVGWAVGEAVLRDAPLRIVSAVELPPRMTPRKDAHGPSTVAEVVTADRDRALARGGGAGHRDSPGPAGQHRRPVRIGRPGGDRQRGRRVDAGGRLARGRRVRRDGPWVGEPLRRDPRRLPGCRGARRLRRLSPRAGRRWRARPEDCDATLTFAFEEAALHNASLLAVHAWQAHDPDLLPNEDPARGSHDGQAAPPGNWKACWPAGGRNTPASPSARKSCTAIRAGPWQACPPAPAWSWSAGIILSTDLAESSTPC